MNKDELLLVAKETVHQFWRENPDIRSKVHNQKQPYAIEHSAFGEDDYWQMEIDVVPDDGDGCNVRVSGLIDNGRDLKGGYALIVGPDGTLISEGGRIRKRFGFF